MDFDELFLTNNEMKASKSMKHYHNNIQNEVVRALKTATLARSKKLDPSDQVEIYIAQDVATRTEGLVGPSNVSIRLKEMELKEKLSKDDIVLKIAREIASGKFISGTPEFLAEQALRTALSYQTEGITAAPIEGIGRLSIKSNPDGSQYLAVFYSGPIRSAGGTAQGVSVFIADEIRKVLGLSRYKATEKESNRMLEEVRLYNRIMHLQLPTTDEELIHTWNNIPIMISGDPTEKEEVGGYRNIESMNTNRVRGGACLVLNDGLVGRAKKILKRIKKLKIDGWDWLEEIANGKYSDKRQSDDESVEGPHKPTPDYSFASDALMGRPTFAGPTAVGGFRLRYGHARNTGIAGIGIHPGVMAVVNDYLAPGTHIRTERPGKGSIVTPVNTINPPMVLLNSGDLISVPSYEFGVKIRDQIKKIVFLGDVIIGYGEFLQNNYRLCPPGYVHEWWLQDLTASLSTNNKSKTNINYEELQENEINFETALDLSNYYGIPLHPKFIFAWDYLDVSEVKELHELLWKTDNQIIPKEAQKFLIKVLIPYSLCQSGLDLGQFNEAIRLQLPEKAIFDDKIATGLELIQSICSIPIRDFIGTTIGARMGRPEKAKGRKMKPQLHGLFPLSSDKKIKRSLNRARHQKSIQVELSNRWCQTCQINIFDVYCLNCKNKTELKGKCQRCGSKMDESPCDYCGSKINYTKQFDISIQDLLNKSYSKLSQIGNIEIKFLEQVTNPTGVVEILEKGILRAKYDLNVFRDGTIRFDATDAPLSHFYPYEIDISISKLLELGYSKDINGQTLRSENQLLELKPQDIIVHKSAIIHLINVANFVDDELEKLYDLSRYYNIEKKEDLLGHLVIGLAPHTSAGVIGRIIGFSDSSVCWAHPYWHSAKRRNCDGDEDGIILLQDGLINFSKYYLPTTRGSKMDTPLVLVATLNPSEVDDEAYNVDCVSSYPLEFYQSAIKMLKPNKVSHLIERFENRLGAVEQFEGFKFTHKTSDITAGPLMTRYKNPQLSIRDKLAEQLALAEKIVAVDEKLTALNILEKHILPDLMGNLRAFASQKVRCITCNTKYRRAPLFGKCINSDCPKSNLVLTVPPKGVTKYMDLCEQIVSRYKLGAYHEDRLTKLRIALESHFSDDGPKQLDLSEWF